MTTPTTTDRRLEGGRGDCSGDGGASGVADTVWRRRPFGAATTVVVVTAVALTTLSIAWAVRLPARETFPASDFLPSDGMITLATTAVGDTSGTYIAEHAVTRGVAGVTSLPTAFGGGMLLAAEELGVDPMAIVVWRETGRRTFDDATGPPVSSLFIDAPAGIHTVAWYGGSLSAIFDPPIPVLPADRTVGRTWSASGDALPGGILTYRYDGTIHAVRADGCVLVDALLVLDQNGLPFSTTDVRETWCPGRGLTDASGSFDAGVATDIEVRADADISLPPITGDPRLSPEPAWGDPTAWGDLEERLPYLEDQLFGEQASSITINSSSVVTGDGSLVVAVAGSGDIMSLEPTSSGARERWRAHPSGSILSLAAVGDMVVVTTSDREVVAYDATGMRRWTSRTADLVLGRALGTSDGLVVTVGLDGEVIARRATDGDLVWSGSLTTDADLPAVMIDSSVIATDRNGTLRAFEAGTGRTVWTAEVDPFRVIGVGANRELIGIDADGDITAFDAATGEEIWSHRAALGMHTVLAVSDTTVIVGENDTVALDDMGDRVWTIPGASSAATDGTTLVAVTDGRIIAVDPSGSTIRDWTVTAGGVGTIRRLIGGIDTVWLVGNDGAISTVGPTP